MTDLTVTLRLAGGRAFVVGTAEAAGGVKALGDAEQAAGDKGAFAAEKTFLFGESMYSLRRYAFYGITALGLTGAAVLKMGYDFDEAKSKGIDTLSSLVGGTRAARTEISRLITLTHSSGLDLSSLVTGSQNMLTFGFSVKQTNEYLSAFANFAGAKRLGAGGVDTLSQLFERVQGRGFLTGRDITGLTSLGIPGFSLLTKGLGLTPSEAFLLQHGQAQIAANVALPQIAEWLNAYAARQPKSIGQRWDIAKSYLSQILGTLGTPAFGFLDRGASSIDALLGRVSAGAQAGGAHGALRALDPSGTLLRAWTTLGILIGTVSQTLRTLWGIAQPFVELFVGMARGLLGITSNSRILRPLLYGLIAGYVGLRGAQLAWLAVTTVQAGAMKALGLATLLYEVYVLRAEYATLALTKAQLLLDAAMDANPIGLIVIGLAALALAAYEVYKHFGWIRSEASRLWHEITSGSPVARAAIVLLAGPFSAILATLVGIKATWDWLDKHWHGIEHFFGFGGGNSYSPRQLLQQQGSLAATLGVSQVVKLDQGAGLTVAQLRQAHAPQALVDALSKALQNTTLKGDMHMDGKKVGDVAFKAKQDAEARR